MIRLFLSEPKSAAQPQPRAQGIVEDIVRLSVSQVQMKLKQLDGRTDQGDQYHKCQTSGPNMIIAQKPVGQKPRREEQKHTTHSRTGDIR